MTSRSINLKERSWIADGVFHGTPIETLDMATYCCHDRLAYDAALSKLEKIMSSKKEKEKDRVEAEDEYELAKSR